MPIYGKTSGLVSQIQDFWYKNGGTVQNPTAVWVKDGGVVKKVWPIREILENWSSGLTNYTQQDGTFTTGTTYNWDGNPVLERTTGTNEDYLWPTGGNLVDGFGPGDILMVPWMTDGAFRVLFGDQDDGPSNQYDLEIRAFGPGIELKKNISGTVTSLYNNSLIGELPQEPNWGVVFIEWDPAAGDPDDSDGSGTGDFLITATDSDFIPKAQFYADVGDTTYRSGQVAISVSSDYRGFGGTVEKVSTSDDRYPRNRVPKPGEIDCFNNPDLKAWSIPSSYTLDGEPNITPYEGDFCLRDIDPTSFSRATSEPGDGLPNYFTNGDTMEVAMQVPSEDGFIYIEIEDTTTGDWIRAENAWEDSEIEVQSVTDPGTVDETAVIHRENTTFSFPTGWLRLQWDRPTSSKMEFTWLDEAGNQLEFWSISGLSEFASCDKIQIVCGGSSVATNYHYVDGMRLI